MCSSSKRFMVWSLGSAWRLREALQLRHYRPLGGPDPPRLAPSAFPQVNPLSFARESLTQPGRESWMGLAFETVFPKTVWATEPRFSCQSSDQWAYLGCAHVIKLLSLFFSFFQQPV